MKTEDSATPPIIYCAPLEKLLSPILPLFNCTESNLETYTCRDCTFKSNFLVDLRRHLSIRKEKKHVCEECGFQTHSILILLKHSADLCRIVRWFKCDQCLFKTTSGRYLRRHKRNKHTDVEKIRWFQCEHCPHRTKWKGNLKGHIASVHLNQRPEPSLTCTECSFSTKWKKCLKMHTLSKHFHVTSPKWMSCDSCPFKTRRKDSLKRHVISLHATDIWKFKCGSCGLKVKRKDHLKRHINEVHGELNRAETSLDDFFYFVQCKLKGETQSIIPNAITEREGFVRCDLKEWEHSEPRQNVISDGPPEVQWFQCEQCVFSTHRENHLKHHIQEAHMRFNKKVECKETQLEDKWLTCDQCPFSTKMVKSLKIHKHNHDYKNKTVYYKCVLCPLKTARKDSLKRHVREKHMEWKRKKQSRNEISEIAVDSELLRCEQCPYSTRWKNSLKMHRMLVHQKKNLFLNLTAKLS